MRGGVVDGRWSGWKVELRGRVEWMGGGVKRELERKTTYSTFLWTL